MQITYAVKDWFLDRAAIADKLGRARQRALLKAGAYVRRAARDLLRRGKKSSQPGRPPHVHAGEPNLKTILFAYDPAAEAVVVGPVLLNSAKARGLDGTLPQLMEQGGEAEVTEFSVDAGQTWLTLEQRQRPANQGKRAIRRRRRARFAAHPFMAPAEAAALPKIPEQFRDLI